MSVDSVARTHMHRYFPSRSLARYTLANLTPSIFQIWIGNGSNGRTTFGRIVGLALDRFDPLIINCEQLRTMPVAGFGTHRLLMIQNWDSAVVIPAARINELLNAGFLIILETTTLPLISGHDNQLLSRTHVIRFKSTFGGREDVAKHRFLRAEVPIELIGNYVRARLEAIQDGQVIGNYRVEVPYSAQHEKLQLIMLANNVIAPPQPQPSHCINNAPRCEKEKFKTTDVLMTDAYAPPPAPAPVPITTDCLPANTTVFDPAPVSVVPTESEDPYASINIHVKHNDNSGSQDLLKIEVDPESDGFVVSLDKRTAGTKSMFYTTSEDLFNYLRLYFTSLAQDSDTYESVQFNVPMFSSVNIDINDVLHYYTNNLYHQIQFLLYDWPSEQTTV